MALKAPHISAGAKYARLTALEDGLRLKDKIRVRCECGTEKLARVSHIVRGESRSCGCLRKEALAQQRPPAVHGHRSNVHTNGTSPTANTYWSMYRRCTYEYDPSWQWYGGRGITICDRWLGKDGFKNFLEDMGERPSGKVIDRIDSDGNYEPGNCRWATQKENVANRRNLGNYGRYPRKRKDAS